MTLEEMIENYEKNPSHIEKLKRDLRWEIDSDWEYIDKLIKCILGRGKEIAKLKKEVEVRRIEYRELYDHYLDLEKTSSISSKYNGEIIKMIADERNLYRDRADELEVQIKEMTGDKS